VTADLYVLVLLAVAALHGTARGALRQLVSFAAAVAGALAARAFAPDVAAGLGRTFSPAARGLAPIVLFLGGFGLASLAGAALLRATGVAKVVRGPSDRAVGALLGGAKGALAAWAVLSTVALACEQLPERWAATVRSYTDDSDFAALARAHNLVARLEPGAAKALERRPSLP
jgi:membrane protein required for colicin V production